MGCGCCTAVEHTPAEQNTWGRGFDSRKERAIFLLFLSLTCVFSIRSLKEVQHNWFCITNKLYLAVQLEENKHNIHRFGKKMLLGGTLYYGPQISL